MRLRRGTEDAPPSSKASPAAVIGSSSTGESSLDASKPRNRRRKKKKPGSTATANSSSAKKVSTPPSSSSTGVKRSGSMSRKSSTASNKSVKDGGGSGANKKSGGDRAKKISSTPRKQSSSSSHNRGRKTSAAAGRSFAGASPNITMRLLEKRLRDERHADTISFVSTSSPQLNEFTITRVSRLRRVTGGVGKVENGDDGDGTLHQTFSSTAAQNPAKQTVRVKKRRKRIVRTIADKMKASKRSKKSSAKDAPSAVVAADKKHKATPVDSDSDDEFKSVHLTLASTAGVKDGKVSGGNNVAVSKPKPSTAKDERFDDEEGDMLSHWSQYLNPADPTKVTEDFLCSKCSPTKKPSENWDDAFDFVCSRCGNHLYAADHKPDHVLSPEETRCLVCGIPMGTEQGVVHGRCMGCSVDGCSSLLDPNGFFLLNGQGFCQIHMPAKPPSCTAAEFSKETLASMQTHKVVCDACRRVVDLSNGVELLGVWFHFNCVKCAVCDKVIESNFTVTDDQRPCCPRHTLAEIAGVSADRFGDN